MGIFACTKRFYTHAARRSHFVFRNNIVCLGNFGRFPVIYRQSDEARQTNPSNYFFPSHFSPFGRSSSPQPSLSPGCESDGKSGTASSRSAFCNFKRPRACEHIPAWKSFLQRTRYSHFVFRNNTVCLGNLGGFPVIYRQSDEARQTKTSNYFFPSHFSPFGRSSSPLPTLSRQRIGRQKAERQSAVPLFALSGMIREKLWYQTTSGKRYLPRRWERRT